MSNPGSKARYKGSDPSYRANLGCFGDEYNSDPGNAEILHEVEDPRYRPYPRVSDTIYRPNRKYLTAESTIDPWYETIPENPSCGVWYMPDTSSWHMPGPGSWHMPDPGSWYMPGPGCEDNPMAVSYTVKVDEKYGATPTERVRPALPSDKIKFE
jgi:hypothetical protein